MSELYFASQYDKAYLPHKLGNHEVPDKSKEAKPGAGASPTKTGGCIVNERGHIIKGAKAAGAFITQPSVWQQSSARWPQTNPAIRGVSSATMGYKGIQTDYLPTSTVPLGTVEGIPGCKERNYAGGLH